MVARWAGSCSCHLHRSCPGFSAMPPPKAPATPLRSQTHAAPAQQPFCKRACKLGEEGHTVTCLPLPAAAYIGNKKNKQSGGDKRREQQFPSSNISDPHATHCCALGRARLRMCSYSRRFMGHPLLWYVCFLRHDRQGCGEAAPAALLTKRNSEECTYCFVTHWKAWKAQRHT